MKRAIGLTPASFAAASRRPGGFTLLAIGLGFYVFRETVEMLDRPALPLSLGAVLALLFTVLAAVAIEALWKVRPWAGQACGALAVVALAAYFLDAVSGHGGIEAMVVGALVAAFLAQVVRYVDSHVQAAHGPTVVLRVRRRVPAARARWRP